VHEINIPGWAVDRVIKRRGAEHVFQDFDPARTALIVIDMQNAFMLPGVAFVEIKTAPEIVPNINRLAGAVRAAGGAVVWIVTNYTEEVAVDWSTYYRLSTPENGERRSNALVKGTRGHQIWDNVVVQAPPKGGHRDSGMNGPAGSGSLCPEPAGLSRPSTRSRPLIG